MTAPAGSEDAGLVLSTEELEALGCRCVAWRPGQSEDDSQRHGADCPVPVLTRIVAARVEAARAEALRDAADEWDLTWNPGHDRSVLHPFSYLLRERAARIARTPPPAGDTQGSQEARNGPVSDEDAGDGRGHGRDDESGRGAGL